MKELLLRILDILGLAYWVEIVTDKPKCTYYFGPFVSKTEAEAAKIGYVEDLQGEDTQGIQTLLKRCKPNKLTIFEDSEDFKLSSIVRFSSQAF